MSARYAPSMVYTDHKSMRNQDRYLNFALVRSPLDRVRAAVGGIVRATENGAVVRAGDPTPPVLHATGPNGRYSLRRRVLVSRPAGADVALVEFGYFHCQFPVALSMMLPAAEVIAFCSNWENKNNYRHELTVHRNGAEVRRVAVDKGLRKSGLSFVAEGAIQRFERPELYEAGDIEDRLTRSDLIEYARRCWLDVDGALWDRNLEEPILLEAYDALEALNGDERVKDRTDRWQAEHDLAVRMAIGPGEEPFEQAEAQEAYLAETRRVSNFMNRFGQALNRAGRDPRKLRAAYEKWMARPERPKAFSPLPYLRGMVGEGGRVDLAGDPASVAYLKREHALWNDASEWEFRITQTVVDQIDGRTQDLGRMDLAVPRAVAKLKDGVYPDAEAAMRAEYGWLLRGIGIGFNPEGPILTRAEADRSCARQFVSMQREFVEGGSGPETVIGPIVGHGAPPRGED